MKFSWANLTWQGHAHVRRSNRRFSLIAENVKFHCCEFKLEYCMVKCNRCKNGMNVQHFNEFECSLRGSLWNKLFKLLIVIIDVSK